MKASTAMSLWKDLKAATIKHSPEILFAVGITGMFAMSVMVGKATPKALALVEEEKLRRYKETDDDTMSKVDVVKTCWKCYIPAVVTGVASTACLFGSRSVSARRTAALAAAYRISETALTDYHDKVLETIGEKKEKVVREKMAEEHVKTTALDTKEVYITGKGTALCLDPLSKRYFQASIDTINKAENVINKQLLHDICGTATLNDFYDELGLEQIDLGDAIGWTTEYLVSIHIGTTIASNGEPCLVIEHNNPPRYNF